MFATFITFLSSVSALACLWMLFSLWRSRIKHRGRLFWAQLVALAATDLLESIAGALVAYVPPPSMTSCTAYMPTRYVLEFSSCFLEIQIAMGFAAACCQADRAVHLLKYAVFMSWPLGCAALVLALHFGMVPVVDESDAECNDTNGTVWGIVVLCSCVSASIFYALGAWGLTRRGSRPRIVSKRMLLRGLTYVLDFLITFSVRAIANLMSHPPDGLKKVGWCLMCLNGAVNAATYNVQNQRHSRSVVFRSHVDMPSIECSGEGQDILVCADLTASDEHDYIQHHFDLGKSGNNVTVSHSLQPSA